MATDSSKRRPYLSGRNYADMMRKPRSRTLWNEIFEVYNQFAEFRAKTLDTLAALAGMAPGLKKAIENFIRQSERKKPYYNPDDGFLEMEDYYEGPPGLPPGEPPWLPDIPPVIPPIQVVFNADVSGYYCPGETTEIVVTSTEPMIGYVVTFADAGTVVSGSVGGNSSTLSISASGAQTGMITIEIIMQTSEGIVGDSNINIFEDSNCDCIFADPLQYDDASSPDTIAPSTTEIIFILDGQPPFDWSVSGVDVTLGAATTTNRSNTVIAGASSCGPIVITIEDACQTIVEGEMRNTNGVWTVCTDDPFEGDYPCEADPASLCNYAAMAGCHEGGWHPYSCSVGFEIIGKHRVEWVVGCAGYPFDLDGCTNNTWYCDDGWEKTFNVNDFPHGLGGVDCTENYGQWGHLIFGCETNPILTYLRSYKWQCP